MIPNQNTYCEIDPEYRGRVGDPVLRFHFQWSDNEIKMARDMQQTFREIVEAGGRHLPATNELRLTGLESLRNPRTAE